MARGLEMISFAIVLLAGALMVAGGSIAADLCQKFSETGGGVIFFGALLALMGLVMLFMTERRAHREAAAPGDATAKS